MAKDNTMLYAGLGLAGLGAYILLGKKDEADAKKADAAKTADAPNFATYKSHEEAAMSMTAKGIAIQDGTSSRPAVLLAGVDEAFAAGLAAAHPGVDFLWTGAPAPEGMGIIPNLPWVYAAGLAATGPRKGQLPPPPMGQPVTGSAASNTAYFDRAITYAKTGA